ncbi:MAG: glycosyltransferase family 39 protein [Deltaproteobacteria bacterium]|nr:glycosyltransferase family 39 protein [Deltaproteobacteria bacterium]MCL4873253.1 glycosyltransferase family 39 protein [bacterium]
MEPTKNENARRISVGLFFAILLAIGLGGYRDYNVSWDEPLQRDIGAATVKHVSGILGIDLLDGRFASLPPLEEFVDKDYGVAFEAPAVALEVLFKIRGAREAIFFRHILTFLVCLSGVYAVYRLASRRFADWRIGLLAALFLVLTPRLFAESFYNSKDAVFMAVFAIAMYTGISFLLRPGLSTAFLHALATALALDVRIMAVILPAATMSMLALRLINRELPGRKTVMAASVYLLSSGIFLVTIWPNLWSDPFGNFAQAFGNMSKFRWKNDVLYMGSFIPASEVPWHYIPTWISITTPVLYLLLFLIGSAAVLKGMLSNLAARRFRLWTSEAELQDVMFLGLFAAPVAAVIALNSTLYDGWRQLYFIYPAFLLLAVRGWVSLWGFRSPGNMNKALLLVITAATIFFTAAWMWKAHPLQNVYFNFFAGKDIKDRYEMDYWGLGNRKALEYILENDKSPVVNVRADSATPLKLSIYMLEPDKRVRIRETDEMTAPYYVLNNYRLFKEPLESKYGKEYDLFYELKVGGEAVLSVFKWKGTEGSGSPPLNPAKKTR